MLFSVQNIIHDKKKAMRNTRIRVNAQTADRNIKEPPGMVGCTTSAWICYGEELS
jgi:hypothetical protein